MENESPTNSCGNEHTGSVELSTTGQSEQERNSEIVERIEQLRLLKIRKKQELKLVKKFDKSKINVHKECWFLIDSDWLNSWSAFVNVAENDDPPGILSNKELLDDNNNPLPNLKAIRDYRGVPPIVYFTFVELYGKDDSPEIARYEVDIYKPPVSIAKMVNIQVIGRSQAKIHVNKVRPKWVKWERHYDDDEEEVPVCCCGLTKEHLEAFIYWAITCWANSRRKSGRGDISYRQYKPLRANAIIEEEEEALSAQRQYQSTVSTGEQASDKDSGEGWLEARRAAEAQTNKMHPKKKKIVLRKAQTLGMENMNMSNEKNSMTTNYDSDSSSSSDGEIDVMLLAGPADVSVESGTWLSASRWWGFSR